MNYCDEVVEKIVARLLSGDVSQRELARVVGIPRETVGRWLRRRLDGKPARFKRAAKQVWNKTIQPLLDKLKCLLEKGKSTTIAWLKLGNVCLRTAQRYKKLWFPQKPKKKAKVKRYERKHSLSLLHTDWGVKRILNGQRCCFSFYVDDASQKLFALHAYDQATLANTLDNQEMAVQQTGGYKAVLTDNARVYQSKHYDAQLGKISGQLESSADTTMKFIDMDSYLKEFQ